MIHPVALSLTDTSLLDVFRRLANSGTQVQLRVTLRLGSGVEIPVVGYPVPGGYRIETGAHATQPEGFFREFTTALGFVLLDDTESRAALVVPVSPG